MKYAIHKSGPWGDYDGFIVSQSESGAFGTVTSDINKALLFDSMQEACYALARRWVWVGQVGDDGLFLRYPIRIVGVQQTVKNEVIEL